MSVSLDQSALLKLRKVARYVTLFGPARTFVKVKGEYHLRRTKAFEGSRWNNPKCRKPTHPDRMVALIGCGSFPYSNIAYYLRKESPHFLRATYDVAFARARSLCADYAGAYAAADFEQILADESVRLLYIASNHASHAEYAIRGLDAGKHVHIEKPHVITEDQLKRLDEAQARNPQGMVFLGFNRPRSRLFARAMEALSTQSGPMMANWSVVGHKIPEDHWYYSKAEGGRTLGNLCHWTDLTLRLIGLENAFPCKIAIASAKDAKSDFAVTIVFADESVAAITFSAKGHTFEGVREMLRVHRGDVLVTLNDFQTLRIDTGPRRQFIRGFFRDHGHQANIVNSWEAVRTGDASRAVSYAYGNATARLFLAVKEADERGCAVILEAEGAIGSSVRGVQE